MKANKRALLPDTKAQNTAMVGTIITLLIAIIVGILVFWNISGTLPLSSTQTETTTSDITGTAFTLPTGPASQGSNSSAWAVQTLYVPSSASAVNVTCYNSTGTSESWPTFTLANRRIDVTAGTADGFNQVNLSYTTKFASEKTGTETMATTVFALLPIIALVVVASIILAIVMMFGKGKKGGL